MRIVDEYLDVELAEHKLDGISGGVQGTNPIASNRRQQAFSDRIEANEQAAEQAAAKAATDYHVNAIESASSFVPQHFVHRRLIRQP